MFVNDGWLMVDLLLYIISCLGNCITDYDYDKEQEITVYEVCAAVSCQCDVSTGGIQAPSGI